MTSPPPSTLAALMPHAYLNLQASPLGPALRQVVLAAARVNGGGLETLVWDVQGGPGQRMMGTHPCGLVVGVTMEPDALHQALVWQVDLAQEGTGAGARLADLCPMDLVIDGAVAPDPVIHTWLGGAMQTFFPPDASTPQSRVLYPGTPAYYQSGHLTVGTRGGRSSDQYMPYVLITTADDSGGLWCAVGWSGHWTARFVKPRSSVDLHLTIQIEPCDLVLPAGTRLRGPSMALGLYRGDYADGCNALRRWLRARMPAVPGDGDLAHFNTWTAMDANVDEARLLDAVDRVAGQGLRYFMLDAGWYPCAPENFSSGVGNWRVDETRFPHGLEVVAERVRAHGMAMGLWIEPERAHTSSELAQRHPDWLLTAPGRHHALVNFARPSVRTHFQAVISDLVRRLGLRWLKWDFNMDPLPCWQHADDGGLSHLGHVDGVWETFDWMRATFPDLVLENCASGGNRLDWTLFSRSVTNFANDQYTQPDCMRRIMGRMGAFLPTERLNMIYGPYQRREYGDDAWQVLMGSAFGVSEPLENWTEGFRDALRRHLTLHRATEAARQGSFYRLTPDTPRLRAWEAWQLHDPDAGAGVLIAWRAASPDDRMLLLPRAIDVGRTYTVSDLYGREEQTVQGATLRAGLRVSLPPHGAALRAYRPTHEKRTT